jgi:DNA polymerase-3 subunit gamma/tau
MSYVVLARKWRPQSFEDLVGQDHVSTTLGNAIAQNRVAHAFLFTGVRGVGKTTSARIMAKALNCANGPTATPCQQCPACKEITAGNDVDVQEIDGASYNGVDEVRRLQESLPYRPQRDRFKIFIVDEVHMLSNAAWNAFLKTLEEPPPHVKFIFATTEVHKVPVTILSRCQRYDFKLITAQQIAARLRWVLEQEKVLADDGAVAAIAREAAGSMRDAMSLLDQVIAWVGTEGDKLTGEGVAKVLGVADREVLHRLAESVLAGNAGEAVRIVGQLAREGYDLPHVARDFLAHLRDLVIAKISPDPGPLLDLADAEVADVKALVAHADADDLLRLHQGFSRSFDDIVRSGQPRASLEMTLVRLSRRPPLLPVDELLRRLGDLERRLGGGAGGPGAGGADRGGPPRGAPPGGPGGGPAGGPPRRLMQGASEGASSGGGSSSARTLHAEPAAEPPKAAPIAPPTAQHDAPAAPPPPQTAAPEAVSAQTVPPQTAAPEAVSAQTAAQEAVSAQMAPAQTVSAQTVSAPTAPPPTAPPPTAPPPTAPPPTAAPQAAPPPSGLPEPRRLPPSAMSGAPNPFVAPTSTRSPASGPPSARSAPFPSSPPNGAAPRRPSTPPPSIPPASGPAPRSGPTPELGGWRSVLQIVREKRPALASVLEHAVLLHFSPLRVEIGYEANSFLVGQATEASSKELLLSACRAHFGATPDLVFETIAARGAMMTVAQVDSADRRNKVDAARRAVADHPLVTAAIELLGAELKDVKLAADADA